jgi:hypothetical protein
MSNSGDDQPLAPRRSLRKTPGAVDVDATTQPVMAPSYVAGSQPPQSKEAPAPKAPPAAGAPAAAAGRPPAPTYAGQPDRKQERTQPQPAAAGAAPKARRVRRARLRLLRVDPWSITKIAFLLSIALGIMFVVAVFLVVSIMNASGLWDNVNETIQGVLNQQPADAFDIKEWVGIRRVVGLSMLIAVLDVVLITALATLGAFLYNLAASLLGGVEVTLAEDAK